MNNEGVPTRDVVSVTRELEWIDRHIGRLPISGHEALGLLLEEFDEFKASVHANVPSYAEAMQLAAVAIRTMAMIRHYSPAQVESELIHLKERWEK